LRCLGAAGHFELRTTRNATGEYRPFSSCHHPRDCMHSFLAIPWISSTRQKNIDGESLQRL